MSMRELESQICTEARNVLENKKLRVKDMLEWSTGKVTAREGEIVVFLPVNKVSLCVLKDFDKRKPTENIDPSRF